MTNARSYTADRGRFGGIRQFWGLGVELAGEVDGCGGVAGGLVIFFFTFRTGAGAGQAGVAAGGVTAHLTASRACNVVRRSTSCFSSAAAVACSRCMQISQNGADVVAGFIAHTPLLPLLHVQSTNGLLHLIKRGPQQSRGSGRRRRRSLNRPPISGRLCRRDEAKGAEYYREKKCA
jgi:hypothetical protein